MPVDVAICGENDPTIVTSYTYEVVNTYPHDPSAFTEGLAFWNGELLESTGLRGLSSLRKVDLASGHVLKRIDLPEEVFAEGLTVLGEQLFQLTWRDGRAYVYDTASLEPVKELSLEGEGWGLATDGEFLIVSDGTDRLRFLDPRTLDLVHEIQVIGGDTPVWKLNELEYIQGCIYANVWDSDLVVRIDPLTGRVNAEIDFAGLLSPTDRRFDTESLNGIAFDSHQGRLFVTGKRWPKLFEVRTKPK